MRPGPAVGRSEGGLVVVELTKGEPISDQERLLLTLYRYIPDGSRYDMLVELGRLAVYEHLCPESLIEEVKAGFSTEPPDLEEVRYHSVEEVLWRLQPFNDIQYLLNDWWHVVVEDLFTDGKAVVLFSGDNSIEHSSDLLISLIRDQIIVSDIVVYREWEEWEPIARHFLVDYRRKVLNALESAIAEKKG